MADSPRRTTQSLLPLDYDPPPGGSYDIYPSWHLPAGSVFRGFGELAQRLRGHSLVLIDGYGGVLWDSFVQHLKQALGSQASDWDWVDFSVSLKPSSEIQRLTEPFTGGHDPLFGTRATLCLADFFDEGKRENLTPALNRKTILFGTGSFLSELPGLHLYLDIPKNEIQYRARAGSIFNLGMDRAEDPKAMYKRFYFVDWVVLNAHKKHYLKRLDLLGDVQHPDDLTWMEASVFREGLSDLASSFFRVRPWFEPGTWGGQWIKRHIPRLSTDVPNYAWSFELIVPENGLLFDDGRFRLEAAFDWLMFQEGKQVLGEAYARFCDEFPIRFDFLDTVDGGNLSIQVHPGPEYIKAHFGENFAQEECYYMLHCEPDSAVYLGFTANIDPARFRKELEHSQTENCPVAIENFVQRLPAKTHDLFLIPPGTIHGSGKGNLVLEISSTPYIFTFKLYDWLRPDLDGRPRPLNIDRGFANLQFERNGRRVLQELVAVPQLLDKGDGWEKWHLPTHINQLYDVWRYDFFRSFSTETNGRCLVCSLVEGTEIVLETREGNNGRFAFAETFVIPAGCGSFRVHYAGHGRARLVMAFVKPSPEG